MVLIRRKFNGSQQSDRMKTLAPKKTQLRRGFTLAELLVSMIIIGLLISLLIYVKAAQPAKLLTAPDGSVHSRYEYSASTISQDLSSRISNPWSLVSSSNSFECESTGSRLAPEKEAVDAMNISQVGRLGTNHILMGTSNRSGRR